MNFKLNITFHEKLKDECVAPILLTALRYINRDNLLSDSLNLKGCICVFVE